MITKPPRCFTMSWVFPLLLDTKMGSIFIPLLCHYSRYFGFSLITRYKGEVYFYPLSFVIVIPVFDFTDVQPTSPPTRGRGSVLHFVLSGFLEIPFHVAVHITGTLFFTLLFPNVGKQEVCLRHPPRRAAVEGVRRPDDLQLPGKPQGRGLRSRLGRTVLDTLVTGLALW